MQLPFTPVNNTCRRRRSRTSAASRASAAGPAGAAATCSSPGAAGRARSVADLRALRAGQPAYQDRLEQLRANVGVAWRPNVQDGLLRDAARRSGAGDAPRRLLDDASTRSAWTGSRERSATTPAARSTSTATTTTGFLLVCRRDRPLLFRQRTGSARRRSRPRRSIRSLATTANNVNIFDPNLKTPRVHSVLGRPPALARPGHGGRSPLRRQPQPEHVDDENWNERNIFENGFLNEFKLAQANLRANIAAGRGNSVRLHRAAPGTSPLPIYLAYLSGRRRDAGNPAAYTARRNFTNTAFTGALQRVRAGRRRTRPTTASTPRVPRQRAHRGPAARTSSCMNPAVRRRNIVADDRRARSYDSAAARSAPPPSQGLLVGANYTYGVAQGARRRQSLHFDRIDRRRVEQHDVPHAFKMQLDLRAAGRPRPPLRRDMNPVAERGRSATGSSRAPAACSSERYQHDQRQAGRA